MRFLGLHPLDASLLALYVLIGIGNIIALKTLQPIMIKPAAESTDADRR